MVRKMPTLAIDMTDTDDRFEVLWGLTPPGQGVSPPDTPRPGGAPWTPLNGG